jgi:hypothetical protein
MVYHPNEFAISNKQSNEALEKLGMNATLLSDFQDKVKALRAELGADDYLELDWFLYLVNQRKYKATEHTPIPKPPPKPDSRYWAMSLGEGVLLLSEQFHWFPFNQHKGWTVLIALATVVLTLLLMVLWFTAALVFRLRFQYSLRSLLLMVFVVAVPCSWFATEMKQATKQRRAVEAIRTAGGGVTYDSDSDDPFADEQLPYQQPAWLRKLVGDDFCGDIRCVNLADTQVTDARLVHLQGLRQLQELDLSNTQITDAGLVRLQGLTQLQWLSLWNTQVTDQGVTELQQALPNCQIER